MAPQNLSQVFVANDISDVVNGTMLDGSTFAVSAAVGNSLVGVWNAATNAYLTTAMMSAAGPLQIVQTMPSGWPIASPLIDVKAIKRVKYTRYAATVRHNIRLDVGNPAAGKAVNVKIAIRTSPTNYQNFVDPNDPNLDLSGGGFVFPILGNFSSGRTLFNVEVLASEHAATEATLYDFIVTRIAQNKTLNAILSTTDNTSTLDITARHPGVIFDVVVTYSDDSGILTGQTETGFDAGAGNYWQVISDEKACRAKYGNHNRSWLPLNFPTFAVPGNTYEVVEIQYLHDHPADTGIARPGEMNTIRIYQRVAVAANTVADAVFGIGTWGSANEEDHY
jgi:hypothetical protein